MSITYVSITDMDFTDSKKLESYYDALGNFLAEVKTIAEENKKNPAAKRVADVAIAMLQKLIDTVQLGRYDQANNNRVVVQEAYGNALALRSASTAAA